MTKKLLNIIEVLFILMAILSLLDFILLSFLNDNNLYNLFYTGGYPSVNYLINAITILILVVRLVFIIKNFNKNWFELGNPRLKLLIGSAYFLFILPRLFLCLVFYVFNYYYFSYLLLFLYFLLPLVFLSIEIIESSHYSKVELKIKLYSAIAVISTFIISVSCYYSK